MGFKLTRSGIQFDDIEDRIFANEVSRNFGRNIQSYNTRMLDTARVYKALITDKSKALTTLKEASQPIAPDTNLTLKDTSIKYVNQAKAQPAPMKQLRGLKKF